MEGPPPLLLANRELARACFDCGPKELLSPAFAQWSGQPESSDRVVGVGGIGWRDVATLACLHELHSDDDNALKHVA